MYGDYDVDDNDDIEIYDNGDDDDDDVDYNDDIDIYDNDDDDDDDSQNYNKKHKPNISKTSDQIVLCN